MERPLLAIAGNILSRLVSVVFCFLMVLIKQLLGAKSIIFAFILGIYSLCGVTPWTWTYRTVFSQSSLLVQNFVHVTKLDIPLFTQAIVSWNAKRPLKGFFQGWVQARNSKTKRWYSWHKMFEWGSEYQTTFSDSTVGSGYHHVRLEVPHYALADGYRVKIIGLKGARVQDIESVTVCTSNFIHFEHENARIGKKLLSCSIKQVPLISQRTVNHPRNEVLCSPTSLAMLLSYLTGKEVDVATFAKQVYDPGLDTFGAWPFNVAAAGQKSDLSFYIAAVRLSGFAALHDYLMRNVPVVVSVRGALPGAPQDYPHGHLLVVVGWDSVSQKVICHDPAFDKDNKVLVKYSLGHFLAAWERSHRLAYCADLKM